MSEEIMIVKSPLTHDFREAKARPSNGVTTFAVTLPNGTVITHQEQFGDDDTESLETYREEETKAT